MFQNKLETLPVFFSTLWFFSQLYGFFSLNFTIILKLKQKVNVIIQLVKISLPNEIMVMII